MGKGAASGSGPQAGQVSGPSGVGPPFDSEQSRAYAENDPSDDADAGLGACAGAARGGGAAPVAADGARVMVGPCGAVGSVMALFFLRNGDQVVRTWPGSPVLTPGYLAANRPLSRCLRSIYTRTRKLAMYF